MRRYTPWVRCRASTRTTPELRHLQVTLAARLPYRQAAGLLREVLPAAAGFNHVSTRNRTLAVGRAIDEELCREIAQDVPSPAPADRLVVGIDGAFVKAKRTTGRTHLEELAQRDREGGHARVKRHVTESGFDEGVERHQIPSEGFPMARTAWPFRSASTNTCRMSPMTSRIRAFRCGRMALRLMWIMWNWVRRLCRE